MIMLVWHLTGSQTYAVSLQKLVRELWQWAESNGVRTPPLPRDEYDVESALYEFFWTLNKPTLFIIDEVSAKWLPLLLLPMMHAAVVYVFL